LSLGEIGHLISAPVGGLAHVYFVSEPDAPCWGSDKFTFTLFGVGAERRRLYVMTVWLGKWDFR